MMRVIGSVEPPGGNGTTNLMVPFGQSFCARTTAGTLTDAATVPARTARRRKTDISASQILSCYRESVSTCDCSASDFALRLSLGLDIVVLDDLEPALLLGLLEGGEGRGRAR